MRSRWLGMLLVALAIVLGIPIALTMATYSICRLTSVINYPYTNQREIENGVLIYGSGQTPPTGSLRTYPPRARPLDFKWERSNGVTSINLPVWPIPIAMAIIGGLLWTRGSDRTPPFPSQGNLPLRARVVRTVRNAATVLTLGAGLALGSVTVLSFIPLSYWVAMSEDARCNTETHYKLERGGVGMRRTEKVITFGWQRTPPRPGPFEFQWSSSGAECDRRIPIWPLPILMLAIGGVALVRRERSLLALCKDHCLKCGYDLVATPGPICPECGTRRS